MATLNLPGIIAESCSHRPAFVSWVGSGGAGANATPVLKIRTANMADSLAVLRSIQGATAEMPVEPPGF